MKRQARARVLLASSGEMLEGRTTTRGALFIALLPAPLPPPSSAEVESQHPCSATKRDCLGCRAFVRQRPCEVSGFAFHAQEREGTQVIQKEPVRQFQCKPRCSCEQE